MHRNGDDSSSGSNGGRGSRRETSRAAGMFFYITLKIFNVPKRRWQQQRQFYTIVYLFYSTLININEIYYILLICIRNLESLLITKNQRVWDSAGQ
jgi:hypothetical protein